MSSSIFPFTYFKIIFEGYASFINIYGISKTSQIIYHLVGLKELIIFVLKGTAMFLCKEVLINYVPNLIFSKIQMYIQIVCASITSSLVGVPHLITFNQELLGISCFLTKV
jgi:hypothetical protein